MVSAGLRSKLAKHFAAASLAAACVVGPEQAKAAIVYWNVNQPIPTTIDGLYVRIDNQTTSTGSGGTLPGWDINLYASTELRLFAGSANNRPPSTYVRIQGSGGPSSLQPGATVVGPASPFVNNNSPVIDALGVGYNGWTLNSLNYFGFRLNPDDSIQGLVRYGWGSINVGATYAARTLVDIGWENSGASIFVGQTHVPGPVPLLGAGAAFAWSRRLRRRVASASLTPAGSSGKE